MDDSATADDALPTELIEGVSKSLEFNISAVTLWCMCRGIKEQCNMWFKLNKNHIKCKRAFKNGDALNYSGSSLMGASMLTVLTCD